ncbi:type II CAAX endopeptidase family protein [Limibacter armeniacum]|uniref:CPBP family intramembrane glutamic endopeptidase n=1 Tax=Limibacter armeniacum TaxID=466084 RepID=UPI002FE50C83
MTDKKLFPNTILQFVLLTLLSISLASPLLILEQNGFVTREFIIPTFVVLITLFLLMFYHVINIKRGVKPKYFFRHTNIREAVLFSFPIVLFSIGVEAPINELIYHYNDKTAVIDSPFTSLFTFISMSLIGPIIEELIFRNIFLSGLLTRFSPKKAIIISAILFGIVHIELYKIVWSTIFGLYIGYVFYKTNNLTLTSIIHIAVNTSLLLVFITINNLCINKSSPSRSEVM